MGKWKNQTRITIDPGEYYATAENVVITTLLGSCISVCLYDPHNRIAGMNHFMLSSSRYAKTLPVCTTDAGRYGIQAMELLINDMWKRGAKRGNLKAKAFGGGSVLKNINTSKCGFFAVGEVNIRFILEFLQNEKIPLVASDLGGTSGRVIHFSSVDYSVYVRKIIAKSSVVMAREERYWKKTKHRQEESETQIDLWE
jgi:chemotaxis protein CheD